MRTNPPSSLSAVEPFADRNLRVNDTAARSLSLRRLDLYVRHRTELCVTCAYAIGASCATCQPTHEGNDGSKGQDRQTESTEVVALRAFSTSEPNPITHPF